MNASDPSATSRGTRSFLLSPAGPALPLTPAPHLTCALRGVWPPVLGADRGPGCNREFTIGSPFIEWHRVAIHAANSGVHSSILRFQDQAPLLDQISQEEPMRRMGIGMVVLGLLMATSARLGGAETPGAKSTASAPANKAVKLARADEARSTEDSKGEKELAPAASPVEIELQQLRDLLESQARQLQAQSEQLREQQQKMEALEDQLKTANARRESISAAVGRGENGAQSVGLKELRQTLESQ